MYHMACYVFTHLYIILLATYPYMCISSCKRPRRQSLLSLCKSLPRGPRLPRRLCWMARPPSRPQPVQTPTPPNPSRRSGRTSPVLGLARHLFFRITHLHDLEEVLVTQQTSALRQSGFPSLRIAQYFLQVFFVLDQLLLLFLQSLDLCCQIPTSAFIGSHLYIWSGGGGSCAAAGRGGRHVGGNNLRARGIAAARASAFDPNSAVPVSAPALSVSSPLSPGSASCPAGRVRVDVLLRRPAHTNAWADGSKLSTQPSASVIHSRNRSITGIVCLVG